MQMSNADLEELRQAKQLLETPGLAIKITNALGTPIEKGFEHLPKSWQKTIGKSTQSALTQAMKAALVTITDTKVQESSPRLHKWAGAVSGAIGGAFGLPALAIELPVSTVIMLRSIADIARENGEDLTRPAAGLECLTVFALGGPSKSDDAAESGYFAVRTALAKAVTEASEYLLEKTLVDEAAPALVRFIGLIAARFQVQVSEKAAAALVPIIGAAGGATINCLFMDHFQAMSRGHFTVRRLGRKYGDALVKQCFESIEIAGEEQRRPSKAAA